MTYSYQWERCDVNGLNCVDIPGATSPQYLLTDTDVGATIRVRVTDGTTTTTSTPTGLVIAASSQSYDAVVPTLTYPSVTVLRHVVCTTRAQHDAALAGLQAGDHVDCQGITFAGEVEYNTLLASDAKFTYNSGCSFTGTAAGSALPAMWIRNCNHIQFIFSGCPITNIGGDGILMSGGDHVVVDGFLSHDVGRQGVYLGPTVADIKNSFFRGESYNIGLNHAFDNHAEKGTGLHCCLTADTDAFAFHNNLVAIYGHDCTFSGGCVLQVGDNSVIEYGNTFYVKAANMLMEATSQIAGNAVNLWGISAAHDNIFKIVEATNMMGRAVDCNGVYSGSFTNVSVERGRAHLCCQNPNLPSTEPGVSPTQPWDPRSGVVYSGDVLNV